MVTNVVNSKLRELNCANVNNSIRIHLQAATLLSDEQNVQTKLTKQTEVTIHLITHDISMNTES